MIIFHQIEATPNDTLKHNTYTNRLSGHQYKRYDKKDYFKVLKNYKQRYKPCTVVVRTSKFYASEGKFSIYMSCCDTSIRHSANTFVKKSR